MMLKPALFFCALIAAPALAQDRAGTDTAGDWAVEHVAAFGSWESFCDRRSGAEAEVRCYLRQVQVYRPRPQFGALFAFIRAEAGGETLDLGLEFGTPFAPGEMQVTDAAGQVLWRLPDDTCTGVAPCALTGATARDALGAMARGAEMRLAFTDQYGDAQRIVWDLAALAPALADLRAQSAARGL